MAEGRAAAEERPGRHSATLCSTAGPHALAAKQLKVHTSSSHLADMQAYTPAQNKQAGRQGGSARMAHSCGGSVHAAL